MVLAIDPGPVRSAWSAVDVASGELRKFAIQPNEHLLGELREAGDHFFYVDQLVIEKIEAYGMAVGAEVFETVYWSGRFAEAAAPLPVDRVGRKAVKIHLCGSMRARDPNIRAALLDRFGPGKEVAVGTKAKPGPLHGVAGDVWSALAVAVTWADQHSVPGAVSVAQARALDGLVP